MSRLRRRSRRRPRPVLTQDVESPRPVFQRETNVLPTTAPTVLSSRSSTDVVRPETKSNCAPSTAPDTSKPRSAVLPIPNPRKRSAAPKGTKSRTLAADSSNSAVSGPSRASPMSLNGQSRTSPPCCSGDRVRAAIAATEAARATFESDASLLRRFLGMSTDRRLLERETPAGAREVRRLSAAVTHHLPETRPSAFLDRTGRVESRRAQPPPCGHILA
jgi:hypothetical protein